MKTLTRQQAKLLVRKGERLMRDTINGRPIYWAVRTSFDAHERLLGYVHPTSFHEWQD